MLPITPLQGWKNQRVVILGAARQGLALTRYLILHGANVILNDNRSNEQMQAACADFEQWYTEQITDNLGTLTWVLGDHPLSLLDQCDLVCVSGGVPLTLPIILEAQKRGIPISNDTQIFMESVNARVIGITGSAGKTTTTSLVGHLIARALAPANRRAWVGGNIGQPLINELDQIQADDWVVLELSSFQLDQLFKSPQISAILNLTPNHLDRHGTMEAYIHAKANVIRNQTKEDTAILNHDDPITWGLRDLCPGKIFSFGKSRNPNLIPCAYLDESMLCLWDGETEHHLMNVQDINLRGKHNVMNVLAACVIAFATGIPLNTFRESVRTFSGIPHRIEWVRELNNVQWYNDSIATAPERVIAAIYSFSEPLILLLGGRDKDLPWEKLAQLIHQRVHDVILFGEAADLIHEVIRQTRTNSSLVRVSTVSSLREAVGEAAKIAVPGDVVLLSPGGTSFDEFKDFAERGDQFKQWVSQIQ